MADFGKLLRSFREAAGVSMGALARHLGVSVTYISDVERGTRAPLTSERISNAAELLKLAPQRVKELDAAAGEARGFFELGITSPVAREVGATLMRGWPRYSDTDLHKLKEFLDSLHEKEGC